MEKSLSSFITWGPSPILLDLGFLQLRYYGLLFAIGFSVGYLLINKFFVQEGKDTEILESLLVYIVFGTIVGARVGHCFFYEFEYYKNNPFEILKIWKGGLASHGGGIGVLLCLAVFFIMHNKQGFNLQKKGIRPLWLTDRLCVVIPFVGSCIRLGNFFNSEILGRPSEVPWAIIFTRVDLIPRHPAQLYESLGYFLVFILLFVLYEKTTLKNRTGFFSGLMFFLVFSHRFSVEFFKERLADVAQSWQFSMGQWLSLPFIIIGIVLVLNSLRGGKKSKS